MRGIKGLRFAGVLLLLAFAAFAVVWYVTVTSERERYLTSRNFRLLSTIATQLDSSISGQLKTFGTLLSAADGTEEQGIPTWFARARDFVPSLKALDTKRLQTTFDSPGLDATRAGKPSQAVLDDRGAWLKLSIEDEESRNRAVHAPSRAPERSISRSAACWDPSSPRSCAMARSTRWCSPRPTGA